MASDCVWWCWGEIFGVWMNSDVLSIAQSFETERPRGWTLIICSHAMCLKSTHFQDIHIRHEKQGRKVFLT